jgi:hypothetical protein
MFIIRLFTWWKFFFLPQQLSLYPIIIQNISILPSSFSTQQKSSNSKLPPLSPASAIYSNSSILIITTISIPNQNHLNINLHLQQTFFLFFGKRQRFIRNKVQDVPGDTYRKFQTKGSKTKLTAKQIQHKQQPRHNSLNTANRTKTEHQDQQRQIPGSQHHS